MDLIIISFIFLLFISLFFFSNNLKQKLDVAVIVEPRKDPILIKVLNNYLELLPKNTKIQIFHGTNNEKFIWDNFHNYIKSNKIIMTNLYRKNLTINDYNLLLTSKNFYNKIEGENILIFQMDTCLCSNSKYKIEDFLNYDYVGAPWVDNNFINKIGNGGLSFRKKSKILNHINTYHYDPTREPEDKYFSNSYILKFPSVEKASYFSTEHLFNPYSIGLHKPYELLNNYQKTIIRQTCPEYQKVFE